MRWFVVMLVACGDQPAVEGVPTPAPTVVDAPAASPPKTIVDASAATQVTIVATGDLMLGSTYPDVSGGALPPRDASGLLAEVTPILSAADVAFGNLEAPLFDGTGPPSCTPGGIAERNRGRPGTTCWAFRMPVRFGMRLVDAGYDVVSLANNHVDDFGAEGRASTLAELDRLGIAHSGAPGSVAKLGVRGQPVHVIAFAPYAGQNDMNDLDAARALVQAAAASGARVVVSFHGGAEGVAARNLRGDERETFWGEDRGAVRPFARAMIDAGADLVVGHGPHVLRALELYRGRLIAYSLGTFASYRGINVDGVLGVTMILEVTLAPDGAFAEGRIHSVVQRAPGGPRLDPARRAVATVRALSRADVGSAAPRIAEDGTLGVP